MKFPLTKCCAVCEAEAERVAALPALDIEAFAARATELRAKYEEDRRKHRVDNPIIEVKDNGNEASTRQV